jgi:hypothetical protein
MLYSQDTIAWIGGVLFGLGVGAWSWIRIDPPGYVENWNTGAEGERKTAKALRPLEGLGWHISHDIQTGYGNYDHVVVGPGGVFLLETKYLGGTVEMRDGVPWVQQKLYPDQSKPYGDIRRQTLGNAARLKEEIEEHSGYRTWVQAVVVFWSEFPKGLYEDQDCVFLHGSRVANWLQGRKTRFDSTLVDQVSAGIKLLETERAEPRRTLVGV